MNIGERTKMNIERSSPSKLNIEKRDSDRDIDRKTEILRSITKEDPPIVTFGIDGLLQKVSIHALIVIPLNEPLKNTRNRFVEQLVEEDTILNRYDSIIGINTITNEIIHRDDLNIDKTIDSKEIISTVDTNNREITSTMEVDGQHNSTSEDESTDNSDSDTEDNQMVTDNSKDDQMITNEIDVDGYNKEIMKQLAKRQRESLIDSPFESLSDVVNRSITIQPLLSELHDRLSSIKTDNIYGYTSLICPTSIDSLIYGSPSNAVLNAMKARPTEKEQSFLNISATEEQRNDILMECAIKIFKEKTYVSIDKTIVQSKNSTQLLQLSNDTYFCVINMNNLNVKICDNGTVSILP